jgi:hypothetical protein
VIIFLFSYLGEDFKSDGLISLTLHVNLFAFSFFYLISSINLLPALSGIANESSIG